MTKSAHLDVDIDYIVNRNNEARTKCRTLKTMC